MVGAPANGARVFFQVKAMCAAAHNTEKKTSSQWRRKRPFSKKIRQGSTASGSAYRGFAARKYSSQNTQYSTSSAPVPASHAMNPSAEAKPNSVRPAWNIIRNMHP